MPTIVTKIRVQAEFNRMKGFCIIINLYLNILTQIIIVKFFILQQIFFNVYSN
jgi:hypothetical protein